MELYERIKKRREELGMSQDELAQKLGYKSRSTIAKIEKGENDITQSKIVAFAQALQTTPGELMGWDLGPAEDNLYQNDSDIPVLDDPDIRLLARNSRLDKDPKKQKMLRKLIQSMLEDDDND